MFNNIVHYFNTIKDKLQTVSTIQNFLFIILYCMLLYKLLKKYSFFY